MNKKLTIISTLTLASLVGSAAFFLLTNPSDIPVSFLAVPVLLVFVVCSLLALLFMHAFALFSKDQRRQRAVTVVFGALGSLFLVFQSTGGLVAGDVILIALIFVVSYIYIAKI